MIVPVEIVLRGRDRAVIESVVLSGGEPATWDDDVVRELLIEVLRAIGRAEDPTVSADRAVMLQGFSWIVEPVDGQVVIAIEIPMGAAVAGPIPMAQSDLDRRITRILRAERGDAGRMTIH